MERNNFINDSEDVKDILPRDAFITSGLHPMYIFPDSDEDLDKILGDITAYHSLLLRERIRRTRESTTVSDSSKSGVVRLMDLLEVNNQDQDVEMYIQNDNLFVCIGGTEDGTTSRIEEDFDLIDTALANRMHANRQFSLKNRSVLAFYYISKYILRDTKLVSGVTKFTALHACLDILRETSRVSLNVESNVQDDFIAQLTKYPVDRIYSKIFGRYDVTSLIGKDAANMKRFLYKELSFDRNMIDPDSGYAFEYKNWQYFSKKTYLKYKWFSIISNIPVEMRRDYLVDNVALVDVQYYIQLGFSRFSGSFSSVQLSEMYGPDFINDKDFESAKYIIVDPVSGLFKYNNNGTTNDMDSFGYSERYGMDFENKVLCLLWGSIEKDSQILIKMVKGNVVPFVPHKLFYFFFPNDSIKLKAGFPVRDNSVKSLKLAPGRYCAPYQYACIMNLLRDYILVTPDFGYDEIKNVMDVKSLKTFLLKALEHIPRSDKYDTKMHCQVACVMITDVFAFRMQDVDFTLYVDVQRRSFGQMARSKVKVIDQEPLFRGAQNTIEDDFIEDCGLNPKHAVILDANINSPSTVSSFQFLRNSHVSCRDNDVKMYLPVFVLKDYQNVTRRRAHNSKY